MRRVLATFGNGDCGRLGHSLEYASEELPRVVRALLGVPLKAVACGGAHTAAVDDSGTVYTWGLNDKGQLGHDSEDSEVGLPGEVAMPERVVALSAGYYHTLCVGESGSVWSFGCNGKGQLGLGKDVVLVREPRLVKSLQDNKVVAVAAGMEHSLALTAGGEVYSWGNAANGRLGHGSATPRRLFGSSIEFLPRLVRAFEALRVEQVSAGQMHSAAVSTAGDAFLWGYGKFHQLGFGSDEDLAGPTVLPPLKGSTAAVACGSLHSLALQYGGHVLAWGTNQNGVLGQGHEKQQQPKRPSKVPGVSAEQIAAGWKHSAAVTGSGKLYTWGWGGSQGTALSFEGRTGTGGQLGHGNDFDYWSPHHVDWLSLTETDLVACGMNHTAAIVELDSGVSL
ncbi:hypothetical protein CHLNCDRAFT_24715 [Chlorella variabilis]|uniref:RCC1-like domain-containing protein n=1 Tax=Chlorella variabilis TaxID=554065 RepID=E1ZIJ7_CHLVA|nr:hypothetical protein CHLNCDRAFT_24715 [Chlorella variabilis]EFN54346.1 hypothetical protein CHLNCDRAFT_24715 [Chlorella variabilis]|eukprot:XP_005846448.1 hypothetical protein CHLNCDRAFT_24715 [Chlorella variabilis]